MIKTKEEYKREKLEQIEKNQRLGIAVKDLTIDFLKSESCMFRIKPDDELFLEGILIDMQSRNLMCTIYDNLSDKNKARFNSVLQDKWKLAGMLDKMWSWVK